MKSTIIVCCVAAGLSVTSCSTVSNTYSAIPIQSSVEQTPTVTDLDVKEQKVEKTASWNWNLFGSRYSFRQRVTNLTADILKENNADVLVEPQYSYTKKSFGKRTLTIFGFPAKYKDFRTATSSDLASLNTLNGVPSQPDVVYKMIQHPKKKGAHISPVCYARIAYGLNNLYTDKNTNLKTSPKAGYNVTLGMQMPLGQSHLFYDLSLGLATNSAECKEYDFYNDRTIKTDVQFTYIHIEPLQLTYKIALGSSTKVDIHAGGFVAYNLFGSIKQKGGSEEKYHISDGNGFDAGIRVGAGVWFGKCNVDFTYHRGFLDMPGIDGVKASSYMIGVGYAF